MKWFKKKKKFTGMVFPFGSHSSVGNVSDYREMNAFDEVFAESHRASEVASREFLGVTMSAKRLRVAAIFSLVLLFMFIGRAAQLQVIQGDDYRRQAEGNSVRIERTPSLRGIIYDRNHNILAENSSSFRLTATPADLSKDQDELVAFITSIAEIIDGSIPEMLSLLANGINEPYEPVVIADGLDYEHALKMMVNEDKYKGIKVESSTERHYITKDIPSLSHVLGYTGRINQTEYELRKDNGYRRIDNIGKTGVEKTYENELRGVFGRKVIEVDAFGNEKTVVANEDAGQGKNLILSIDSGLTAKVEQVIEDVVGTGVRTSVIIVDPNNGEILSLVSTPSYNANVFAKGVDSDTYRSLLEDPNQPLFNRAISGEFPSGSTFKPFVASAALQEGIITENTSFLSVGGINIGPWFFPDWKAGGHGLTNVISAISNSVNTFFYTIGGGYDGFTGLGVERMMAYARLFGFGNVLGIDLPGESSGFLPSKQWKQQVKGERWYIGDTYHVAIGQGDLLVTPLQVAMATSVIANGGTLYQPKVAKAIEYDDQYVPLEPVVLNDQVVSKDVINIVSRGMRETVLSGSARSMKLLPVTSAGKTGTAQWSTIHPTHAWFTGFAPYENPELVITVLVEEGGGGDRVAVPIAREILKWWFNQYNIKADNRVLDESTISE